MADPSIPDLSASALRYYPEHGPADKPLYEQLVDLWTFGRSFVVVSGPPGVGKTRASEDFILEMLRQHDSRFGLTDCRIVNLFPDYQNRTYSKDQIQDTLLKKQIDFVWELLVLHPQYSYEDLIRGIRLGSNTSGAPQLIVREGILGFISRVTEVIDIHFGSRERPSSVLVLDEINRAAIGQLFGEAIYALDRRGISVSTPYDLPGNGCLISIPSSLYVLGTMNSVDRAISGIDFALKRRFATLTIEPRVEAVEKRYENSPGEIKNITRKLFLHFSDLITSSTQIGVVPTTELVIGHSYFLAPEGTAEPDDILSWLAHSIQYQILPTLIDYSEQGLIRYDRESLSENPFGDFISGKRSLGALTQKDILEILGGPGISESEEESQ